MFFTFFIYVCNPKFLLIGIGIRKSWLQKYNKSFATYLQIGKKSNNQSVKEGKISPWR